MSPDLALQKAILQCLRTSEELTTQVPVEAMRDGQALPQMFPSITIGEGQWVREPLTLGTRHQRVYADLHVWTKSMVAARSVAGAIRAAIEGQPVILSNGHHAISTLVTSCKFLRDPDGETAHGVVSVESLIERAP